jgi:hypothetical protein
MITAERLKLLAIFIVTIGLISVAYVYGKRESRSEVTKEYEKKLVEQEHTLKSQFAAEKEQIVHEFSAKIRSMEEKLVNTEKETVFNKDGTITIKEKTKVKTKTKKTSNIADKKSETKEKIETKTEETKKETVVQEKSKEKVVKSITSPPTWRVYGTALMAKLSQPKNLSYGAGVMYDLGPYNIGAYGLHLTETKQPALGITAGVSF